MTEMKKKWPERASLIAAIALLGIILVFTVAAVTAAGRRYTELKEADLSRGIETTLSYDDRMYASIGFGISILADETGKEERMASFLSSAVQAIDVRIMTCGLLYSMIVSVVLQYFVYGRYHGERKSIIPGSCFPASSPLPFLPPRSC